MTTRNTGDPITLYDNASIAKYGIQANALGWPHKDLLLVNDADVHRIVQIVLNRQKDDYIGVSSIDLDADQDRQHLYGVMAALASTALGNTSRLHIDWHHPNGTTFEQDLRAVGMHGAITMEGKQAKFTMQIRTTANSGPVIAAADWDGDSVDYTEGNFVQDGGTVYVCDVGHTSSADTEPGVGDDWEDFWHAVDTVDDLP